MKIRFNEDTDHVQKVRAGLFKREGYCPCKIEKIEDNYCMCKEFRDQIADPNYEGFCHCMYYYKEL